MRSHWLWHTLVTSILALYQQRCSVLMCVKRKPFDPLNNTLLTRICRISKYESHVCVFSHYFYLCEHDCLWANRCAEIQVLHLQNVISICDPCLHTHTHTQCEVWLGSQPVGPLQVCDRVLVEKPTGLFIRSAGAPLNSAYIPSSRHSPDLNFCQGIH